MRWEPPVTVILRRATRDTELAGVTIEEGADIALLIGAANRDERKYADPDRYDMFREQRQHVGFGFGVHVCLGMHLARMESRVAINTLFDRLGPFTLDPDGRAAAHRGDGLPLAALAAGGVRPRGLVSGAWAAEPTRCRTQRPSGRRRPGSVRGPADGSTAVTVSVPTTPRSSPMTRRWRSGSTGTAAWGRATASSGRPRPSTSATTATPSSSTPRPPTRSGCASPRRAARSAPSPSGAPAPRSRSEERT